jgi:hypothetical protein
MQGIGKSLPIDPNRLLTAYSKLAAVGSPDAEMLKQALIKYIQSPRKFSEAKGDRSKPTTDTVFSGEGLAPRSAKPDPNDRGNI